MLCRCRLVKHLTGIAKASVTNEVASYSTKVSTCRGFGETPLPTAQHDLRRPCKRTPLHGALGNGRGYVTKNQNSSQYPDDSIFSPKESAWDHVFSDIKDMPPLLPSAVQNPLRPATGPRRARRQAMTAREISAFDEMFNMIFNAVSDGRPSSDPTNVADSGVGVGKGGINDLFGKLRQHSQRMKWTTESDEELDRKKEAMDLCDTDQELLEWAMREVFEESKKYEDAARKAVLGASKEFPMLQPPTYPHLIALLMRAFRDKYSDPHLALSIFDHARHLSIASYVFGCSTQAYNELIETRWTCFRDLKGVYDALEEMQVNGIGTDSKTRKLVDTLRREVGERNLWVEENELGSDEVWNMLAKIEGLAVDPKTKRPKKAARPPNTYKDVKWDDWKTQPLEDQPDDDWGFDHWEKPKSSYESSSRGKHEGGFGGKEEWEERGRQEERGERGEWRTHGEYGENGWAGRTEKARGDGWELASKPTTTPGPRKSFGLK